MNGISPWVVTVKERFVDSSLLPVYRRVHLDYSFEVYQTGDSIWTVATWPKGNRVAFRLAYSPNDNLRVKRIVEENTSISFSADAIIGKYKIRIDFPDAVNAMFRYITSLKPSADLLIPFWPRDMVMLGKKGDDKFPGGEIHVTQEGARSGLQYITVEKTGALLYMQNLTALNDYCTATETAATNVVGGNWPELGFALPPTIKDKPLPKGKAVVISDAFVLFDEQNPKGETGLAKQFLNFLSNIYIHLPKPDTQYHEWPVILENGLYDLENSHACWTHVAGFDYLNAYVSDYKTPPELMVQLAVLLPLLEYKNWSGKKIPVIKTIKAGIEKFYNEDFKTVVRWLPSVANDLDGNEEQLKPNVMDSWYLLHPMLNLSRLALQGDKHAEELFLNSIDFTVKVARHFNYNWPVFYDMKTLDIIKAETKPGMGGEKDVAGLYADVMLQAWAITNDKKYFKEAEKAAKTLKEKGFAVFYQANNTAYAAHAMLRLFKETKDEQYLDLSYLCIAGIVRNMQLWECDYGYAKHYSTFFGMFPLNDAPYTAAYEEQEVFASFHDYLILAEGEDILPSVTMLLAEFIRYIVQRAGYYFPSNLPEEMLCPEPKMGEIDRKLWIAIEDIQDGWAQSGQVGQEVYGAGVAFGIVPRHSIPVPGEDFSIYVDYPVASYKRKKGKSFTLIVKGDERLSCRLLILKNEGAKLPSFELTGKRSGKIVQTGHSVKGGHPEYLVYGNQSITITWQAKKEG